MFDPAPLTEAAVARWRAELLDGAVPTGREAEADTARVALMEELELLRRSISAVQADLAVGLDASQRAQQAVAGEPAARRGRGVAAQVALARLESPHRGQVFLAVATALSAELPATRAALRAGLIDEYAATLVTRETACLDPADRARVDTETCGDHAALVGVGTRQLVAGLRRRVQRTDPAAVVRRLRRAESERCVSLRPAPDTMAYLTALVPMAQGVAAYAGLRREVDALISTGQTDPQATGRGQVMADLLLRRLTGRAATDAVPVEVNVVISDATLFGADPEPAIALADGVAAEVLPAQVARELVARAAEQDVAWVRRLYARPDGELVAMTSRQRFVRGGLAAFLRVRDQGLCRTPWCDAPARHRDHATPVVEGGVTAAAETQGLCQACNHAKQAPGWSARARPGPGRHVVELTTPTGTTHVSRPPLPPMPAAPALPMFATSRARDALDLALDRLLAGLQAGRLDEPESLRSAVP